MSEKRAVNRYLATLQDYKIVFESPQGKKVLWDLMKKHGVLNSPFNPENANETMFKLGEQNVVLRILSTINIDVKQLEHAIKEQGNGREYSI